MWIQRCFRVVATVAEGRGSWDLGRLFELQMSPECKDAYLLLRILMCYFALKVSLDGFLSVGI